MAHRLSLEEKQPATTARREQWTGLPKMRAGLKREKDAKYAPVFLGILLDAANALGQLLEGVFVNVVLRLQLWCDLVSPWFSAWEGPSLTLLLLGRDSLGGHDEGGVNNFASGPGQRRLRFFRVLLGSKSRGIVVKGRR